MQAQECRHFLSAGPLREVESFGPQPVASGFETVALPIGVGSLTALSTRNIDTADRLSLFIPGFTGSKEDFIEFLPALREAQPDKDARALVGYSQRGQADSAAPDGESSYRLEDFIADGCEILSLLGAAGRPVDLVGHSFGGVVARRVALRMPHYVRSLVLFSTGATPIAATEQNRQAREMLRAAGPSIIYRGAYPEREDRVQSDPYVEMFRLRSHATSADNLLSISSILGSYDDVTDELAETGIPMLSVHGVDDDVWTNEVYDDEARRLAIASVSIHDAGHSAQLDQPVELARVLTDFWDRLPPTQ